MNSKAWISFEGRKYLVAKGERALDAMLRQGAPVSFSCRKGACRSCMLQATSGDPGAEAVERLPEEFREHGFFLPCCATDVHEVEAMRPDLSLCTSKAIVVDKTFVTPDILRLRLEREAEMSWQPGKLIGLMNPGGDVRTYSIVTDEKDYYLEVHVRVYENGAVSGWLANGLKAGDEITIQGPSGDFIYNADHRDRPLVLVATGTGGGAILGIVRKALDEGHRGPIHVYHGGRSFTDLYLRDELTALASSQVSVNQAASREAFGEMPPRRITDILFEEHKDFAGSAIYLCGNPDMIETVRVGAMARGASLDLIHADPFEAPADYKPQDDAKLASIEPDPELWAALGNGEKLSEILHDFYTKVYEDPQLAPFFHRTTKQRAIEKQYNFLQDLLSGTKLYFGEKPFNSHHWMVISNELFDYRERLFFGVVREHGIPEKLMHRWSAIHELFRREIVKSAPRGILHGGEEVYLEGYCRERLDVSTVCDGCHEEIVAGDDVLMHRRTGEIYCTRCEDPSQAQEPGNTHDLRQPA